MKAMLKTALQILLLALVVPQLFILCYFFSAFFRGGDPWGLLKALALYALTISWVSAPFIAALALLVRALIGARVRWFVLLPVCLGAGGLWLAAWNLLVYDMFAYLRSFVPILLCSAVTAGWALVNAAYQESLKPPEKSKFLAADLSE